MQRYNGIRILIYILCICYIGHSDGDPNVEEQDPKPPFSRRESKFLSSDVDQDVYYDILSTTLRLSTVISEMTSVEEQYKALFDVLLPISKALRNNIYPIEQTTLKQWDHALNQLNECNKEGLRYMVSKLKELPKGTNMTVAELSNLYTESMKYNKECAINSKNVVCVIHPEVLNCTYDHVSRVASLYLPMPVPIHVSSERFIKSFEKALEQSPVSFHYSDMMCEALQVDRSDLKAKVLELLYGVEDLIYALSTMNQAMKSRHYDRCIQGYKKLHECIGSHYVEKSSQAESCPCRNIARFSPISNLDQ
jgi:hypothetical protein